MSTVEQNAMQYKGLPYSSTEYIIHPDEIVTLTCPSTPTTLQYLLGCEWIQVSDSIPL